MKKIITAALGAPALVVALAVAAAASPPTAESVVTAGADSVVDQLLAIGASVLPLGATVLALTMGWRFAKKFVRG